MKRIGIALGGGGVRGMAHVAFLKVFDELGIKPSIISGASSGAVVGAMYASGLSGEKIDEIFRGMSAVKMLKLMADFSWRRSSGLIKGKKLVSFIGGHLKCKHFEELEIPLKIIATDFWRRREVVFEKGSLADAIRASISIPGIFEPAIINNAVLIDGGFMNPVPYDVIRDDCDILVAIDVLEEIQPKANYSEKPSLFESLIYPFYGMQKSMLELKLLKSKPDIYMKPFFKNVKTLELNKARQILDGRREEAEIFRKKLLKEIREH